MFSVKNIAVKKAKIVVEKAKILVWKKIVLKKVKFWCQKNPLFYIK